ncbi:hypothetical protein QR680_007438 [Steinernema hermaphroditum]|uniref:FAD dependent oxidoreductase domain-containing protein n=1 Tax=Steinernema hermaphroditum TaxID=289476 RepID=A0AA39IFD2_9BILA|nr:hypothetical protein QR680_007438 [Steinernema hermaphroditum]
MAKVAVVGQGVIGCSSALAILEKFPKFHVTLFADRKFEETCSFVPAGLFRLDKYEYKNWARISFDRFAWIYRTIGCSSGVKLVSGHIQSDNRATLEGQEKNMADIVYNFRWLDKREMESMFVNPSPHCIHYTAYASEGRRYVPWLREQIEKYENVRFEHKKVADLNELGEHFDFVINCAGLDGGKVAGDDNTVNPNFGVAIEVEAPWQTHFNYKDFCTFTIPMTNSVILGSLKQPGRSDMEITKADRDDIWKRYLEIHPTFKDAKVIAEFPALRPERPEIRLETEMRRTPSGKEYQLIHNYGHGGNGFTLGWGCALEVVEHIDAKVDAAFNSSKL